jgi:hypothetical protein
MLAWVMVSLNVIGNLKCELIRIVKKQLTYFLVFFVLPIMALLTWWGLFSGAQLTEALAPAHDYVYLEAQGPYSKLSGKQDEVLFYMKQQHLIPHGTFTLVMTDPRTTDYQNLLARTGYLVDGPVKVAAPLMTAHIHARKVVSVSIKAHPLIAYGKTYAKLLAYCKAHQMNLKLPTVEIFDHSVLTVEMPLDE